MHTQITSFVQITEFALPIAAPQPVVFEPARAIQPAEGGVVREFTAKVLRLSAEAGLSLADRIAPERTAA